MGYMGAYTAVKRYLAAIRPEHDPKPYELRFETKAARDLHSTVLPGRVLSISSVECSFTRCCARKVM
jgi:hypothetical protein